jgi:Ca2+/Na+ antiporter
MAALPSFADIVRRLSLPARALGAIAGGYVVTSLAVACLARTLPMAPAEASIAATLASFAIFAVIILAAFSARSVLRLWLWLGGAMLVLGAGLWLSIVTGGRL